MGFHEQRTTALAIDRANHFPCFVWMIFRVGTDQLNGRVTQVRGRPDRAMLGIHEVGATARVGDFANVHDSLQVTVLGIHNGDLVGVVGGGQEVTHAGVPSAIVQIFSCINGGDGHVVQVFIVGQHDLAGFFDVNNEFRVRVGGYDGGNTGFRMVLLIAHGHAPGAHDLLGLKGVAVHDHELWRPVGACNHVLVFPALELGGFNRACFHADLDLGDGFRLFHPQVDHVHQSVTANHEQVAASSAHTGNVYRISG